MYTATESCDSLGPLKTHLEMIRLELLFKKYSQRKTYQYIKVVIAHVQRKFYHRKLIVWALMDLIDSLITKASNRFNLYRIMHTLSIGIYDMGFVFAFCDLAVEAGCCVFTVIRNHKKLLSNESCKNFKMIDFLNELSKFYTYGEIKRTFTDELRLPCRVEAAIKNLSSIGSKRNRDVFVNLTSDDEEIIENKYIYLPSFIYKRKKTFIKSKFSQDDLDSTSNTLNKNDNQQRSSKELSPQARFSEETENLSESVELNKPLMELENDDSNAANNSGYQMTPPLNTGKESKLFTESGNLLTSKKNVMDESQPKTSYSEFYDRKKHELLLNKPESSNVQIVEEVKAVFAKGHVNQEKNDKLFATLNRLLKMKNSKTKKKFSIMEVTLDDQKFKIIERLGAGGFGVVYLGVLPNTSTFNMGYKAIKIQASNSDWEFYINKIIAYRLKKLLSDKSVNYQNRCMYQQCAKSLVKIDKAISFGDHSILIMDFVSSGTLLELSNYVKSDKNGLNNEQSRDIIATFFTLELMKIIACMHKIGIIHGDLKADNCMITNLGKESIGQIDYDKDISFLRLIDFGKSTDMNLFKDKNKKFIHNLKVTDDQDCPEVREKRPFNYEIDYYGIAAIAHTLLFNDYIENRMMVVDGHRKYSIKKNIPRASRDVWNGFFEVFLNSAISNEGFDLPFINQMDVYMNIFKQKLLVNPKTSEVLEKVRVTLLEEKHHNKLN